MTPTWYDILGLTPDASPEQVKAAWRDATDKFEPGSGGSQFRMFNEAADVLLDPDKRAAYDAELGLAPVEPPATPQADPVEPPATPQADPVEAPATPQPVAEATAREPRRIPGVAALTSTLGLAILAVLAICALVLAIVLGINLGDKVDAAKDNPSSYSPSIGEAATSVAERAASAVLAYDYRDMSQSRANAEKFLTPAYRKVYEKNFDGLLNGSAGFPGVVSTKTVVSADVLSSAVVDATPDRVRVLVFVNQNTAQAGGQAKVIDNRVEITMVRQNGAWLVDKLDPLIAQF
ncbi:MAG: J domain-containing protein [Marmoricola sp.]